MIECPECGHQARGRALFCPRCGRRLPAGGDGHPAAGRLATEAMRRREETQGWSLTLTVLLASLAALLLVGGLGLAGVYMGLRDRDRVERALAEDHYARALAYLEMGDLELASAEFEAVLRLDPRHQGAREGLQQAQGRLQVQPTATPALQQETAAALYAAVEAAYQARDWQQVFELADRLLERHPSHRRAEVDAMLFDAYYALALEMTAQERYREAVRLYDRALTLQPEHAEANHRRDLTAAYLTGMSYWGADWERAAQHLSAVYRQAPDFADVRARTREAHLRHAEQLGQAGEWCAAAEHYARALEIEASLDVSARAQEAADLCDQPSAAVTPDVGDAETAPAGTFIGSVDEQLAAGSEVIYVRGQVLDRVGEGVQGLRVEIRAWEWSTVAVTDGNGLFAFDGLADPVTYTLRLVDVPSVAVEAPTAWGRITWVNFAEKR